MFSLPKAMNRSGIPVQARSGAGSGILMEIAI
jgi:hypothetical protein